MCSRAVKKLLTHSLTQRVVWCRKATDAGHSAAEDEGRLTSCAHLHTDDKDARRSRVVPQLSRTSLPATGRHHQGSLWLLFLSVLSSLMRSRLKRWFHSLVTTTSSLFPQGLNEGTVVITVELVGPLDMRSTWLSFSSGIRKLTS